MAVSISRMDNKKMNELLPIVNPASFILNSNPPHIYLIHLTGCFNLF